jgi:hypothetical protein
MNNKNTTKVNTSDIDTNGTSLIGYVTATYNQLKAILGEAQCDCGFDKVETNWDLDINGTVVTIYDWKQSCGGQSHYPDMEYHWHLGGHTPEALDVIKELLTGLQVEGHTPRIPFWV